MKNIFIVIISVNYSNSRKVCEVIQNMSFDSVQDVRKELAKHGIEDAGVCTISDFMDGVNDQYLDTLTDSFISYVKVGK
jgi:hypothetical protein